MKIAIIGSGVGGLGASIRLANLGHEVHVFEKNDSPGGKLSEMKADGFRFDMGPSLFTMPDKVDELFHQSSENPRDHFGYQKLENISNYFFDNGKKVQAWADEKRFVAELKDQLGEDSAQAEKFFKRSERIYDLTHEIFLESSLHSMETFRKASDKISLLNLKELDLLRTVNKAVSEYFSSSEARRIFNRFATYNGSNPFRAPATLNVIPHLEHGMGAYYPEGGMFAIVKALEKLGKRRGVHYHYQHEVSEIFKKGKSVEGIVVNRQRLNFDKVVTDLDIYFVRKKLLGQKHLPDALFGERSSSALIFYLGVKGQYPDLDLHNIFFSDYYEEEFKSIFDNKEPFSDPTVYLYRSSSINPGDAPEGHENWFVMINVPATHRNWDAYREKARKNIFKKLEKNLNVNLESQIVFEEYNDPSKIEKRTAAWKGALYGRSSNGKLAAFLRPPNFSYGLKNLYHVGGTVHPGGGIPLCLESAKILETFFK